LLAPALAQSALWEETFPPDTYEVGSAITDGGTPWVNTQGTQDPVVVEINGNRGAELSESRNGVAVRDIPDAFAATGGNDVYIGATVRFLQPPQDAVVLQFNRTGPLGLVWARNVGNQ